MAPASADVSGLLDAGKLRILSPRQVLNFKGKPHFTPHDYSHLLPNSGRITIYSITGCPHCRKAKDSLNTLNIPFVDINLDIFPIERTRLKQRFNGSSFTVPQIFFNSTRIGGNSELQEKIGDAEDFMETIENLSHTAPDADTPALPNPDDALIKVDIDELLQCSQDEYGDLMQRVKDANIVQDSKSMKEEKVFSGQTFITWLSETDEISREQAAEIGSELINRIFVVYVGKDKGNACCKQKKKVKGHVADAKMEDSPNAYYRILHDELQFCLNTQDTTMCPATEAGILGEELRQLMLIIYERCLSDDGKFVDYECMAKGPQYKSYLQLAWKLQNVQLQGISREEQLAFWINVYNALVIHATVVNGKPKGMFERMKFFNGPSYAIGGHSYTMNQIEHGILRGNRRAPGSFSLPFSDDDPRLSFRLEQLDPRIHAALNCGAKSCPPIIRHKLNLRFII